MFGDNLKKARNKKGVSQLKLSELINVSQKTISSWEVNRTSPSPEMIVKLAEVLETSTKFLLEENTNNTPLSQDSVLLDRIKGVLSPEQIETIIGNQPLTIYAAGTDENKVRLLSQSEAWAYIDDLLSLPPESLGELKNVFEYLKFKYSRDDSRG